jgi:MraZ protein
MFTGAPCLSIDAKGRMAIPTRCRDTLGTEVIITACPSGCLLLFPMEAWAPFQKRVSALPNMDHKVKAMQRMWFAYRTVCELDAAGRVVLTPELRDYANIDRKVQFAPQDEHIELWSEAGWQEQIAIAKQAAREPQSPQVLGMSV